MPKLTVSDLDKELRMKTLRPVYFIHGQESYLADMALSKIRAFVAKLAGEGMEADRFSGKGSKASDIVSCAETVPMFCRHRLVIVTEADALKDAEAFEGYFERPSKSTTLVFIAEKADGRTKFVQLASNAGASIECKALYDDKLPDWVRMESSGRGKSMSMEAAGLVADLVGNSLGELASAIDKIVLFIGQKKTIDASDVETVLTDTGRKNVFQLTDAVGHRDLKEAFRLLKRLSEFHESEVMLLAMLARHWRILIKAREATYGGRFDRSALPKILGVNPFFVDNYLAQAKLFTPKELKSGFRKLYTTDKKLKSSKLPKEAIIERCVRELVEK